MSATTTVSCVQCGTEFTPNKYVRSRVKYCSERCGDKHRYAKDREQGAARARAWREANPERSQEIRRRAHLKRHYGLTPEEYEARLEAQGGKCAVCRKPPRREFLCVDHDHVTGEVRGLLCDACNTVLGLAQDSPQVLRCAIHYLEETTYGSPLD